MGEEGLWLCSDRKDSPILGVFVFEVWQNTDSCFRPEDFAGKQTVSFLSLTNSWALSFLPLFLSLDISKMKMFPMFYPQHC